MDTISTSSTVSVKDANHQKMFYIFLGLIVVLSLVYFIIVKQGIFRSSPLSTEVRTQILQDLATSSKFPVATPDERIEALSTLAESSMSTQGFNDRNQLLNDLAGE